jgi:HEAT repeat protein
MGLLKHPNSAVRVTAATDCLEIDPERAMPVLEDLRLDLLDPYSFEADIVIGEYRKGRLKL